MFVTKGSGVDGTTIRNNYQTMVHILHMKQAATIENIQLIQESMICHSTSSESSVSIRPGNRAKIRFRFTKRNVSISRRRFGDVFCFIHLRFVHYFTSSHLFSTMNSNILKEFIRVGMRVL